jgi:DNA-binding IclR family transcriptional regulator
MPSDSTAPINESATFAIQLIELLAEDFAPRNGSEVHELATKLKITNRSYSRTYGMLQTLVQLDWLRCEGQLYRLSPRVTSIAVLFHSFLAREARKISDIREEVEQFTKGRFPE